MLWKPGDILPVSFEPCSGAKHDRYHMAHIDLDPGQPNGSVGEHPKMVNTLTEPWYFS